jgi:hypothetical protein
VLLLYLSIGFLIKKTCSLYYRTLIAADRGFEPRLGLTKHYINGIFGLPAKLPALRRKSNDWLARNHDNVSEWGDMSIRGLLFQRASTMQFQLSVLL